MLRLRSALIATSLAAIAAAPLPAHATDSVSVSISYTGTSLGTGLVLVTTCTATGSAGAVITTVDCTVNGATVGSTISTTAPGPESVVVRPDAIGAGVPVTICAQGHAVFYPSLATVYSGRQCRSVFL